MKAKEFLPPVLFDRGIATEVIGDAIYRFSQYQCEWMIPQHIIDYMFNQDAEGTTEYISRKLFYLVRRLED